MLWSIHVLLLVATAWAGDDAPPVDPSELVCPSADGSLHLVLAQPDNSTFAAGAGECWLTLNRTYGSVPLRVYIGVFEPGDERPSHLRSDDAQGVIDWTTKTRLFHRDARETGAGTLEIAGHTVAYHEIEGRPTDSRAERQAIVGRFQEGGKDVVVLAHYDAMNREGLEARAMQILGGISLQGGPRTAAASPPPERPADVPAAFGAVPPDTIEVTPVSSEKPTP